VNLSLHAPEDFSAHGLPRLWGLLQDLDDVEGWRADMVVIMPAWSLAVQTPSSNGILHLTFECSTRAHDRRHRFRGEGRLADALHGSMLDGIVCRFHCGGDGDRGSFVFVRWM
jgi:hypothetical protein